MLYCMKIEIEIDIDEDKARLLKEYLSSIPIDVVLDGLNFIEKRWKAKQNGMLMVGRKSKIKNEVSMLSKEQARWRLENWHIMIKNYREKGYSYPTISRIKKALLEISNME